MKTKILCLGLMMLICSVVYAQNPHSLFSTKTPSENKRIKEANFEKNGDFRIKFDEERYKRIIDGMTLPSPIPSFENETHSLDAVFFNERQQMRKKDFLLSFLSEEKQAILKMIPMPPPQSKSSEYQDEWVERIKILRELLNPNEMALQSLLSGAENRIDERKKDYRKWFCTRERPFFNENAELDTNLQCYILENYIAAPSEVEVEEEARNQETARAILGFMQNYDVSVLNEEDCTKRPWYVVGCFFEFVCIESKSPKAEALKENMTKFFPKTHNEFFDWKCLEGDSYTEQAEDAIRDWLISRFAYPETELEQKKMEELLEILKEQLEAVQPWHRALNGNFSDEDEVAKKFLERFI